MELQKLDESLEPVWRQVLEDADKTRSRGGLYLRRMNCCTIGGHQVVRTQGGGIVGSAPAGSQSCLGASAFHTSSWTSC